MDLSNMEIEDMHERLLDAQAVLKLCTPPIELSFKPIEMHGRFHYLIRRSHERQTRLSAISFDTVEEAESLKSNLDYAEQLVSTQLATQTGDYFIKYRER